MKRQLTGWELKGFWPGEPLWTTSIESTVQRRGVTPWIPAAVPGGVHRALEKAGVIEDPYYATNSLLCEWVENRWWVYRTQFDAPDTVERVFLRFDGLDDVCRIFLNGEELARHSGMYEPLLVEVTRCLRRGEPNRLLAVFEQPPREQGQIGWTSQTHTQKARFGYKWDFCTHLVNIGIWQPVWLLTAGPARLVAPFLSSDVAEDGAGLIRVRAQIEGPCAGATVRLLFDGALIEERHAAFDSPWSPSIDETFRLEHPRLWYPNGYGGQPLYRVEVRLDGDSDAWTGRIGVRSLRYCRCDGAPESALPYRPVVNGVPVFLCGVNMTPLDHCYGDVCADDYRRMFDKLRHMHVNMVRVWGGGIIESETFYDLADAYGVLVWQEFIQSSSGIDNRPSHDPAFLALLARNSRAAILGRRGHVSLTWWSGGNELTGADGLPVTEADENIAMLKGLVSALDPQRLFLPSSPSGPSFGLDNPSAGHHDVHGNWQYDGVRRHYEKYNASDSMLQSEFGADGMCSVEHLRRVLPPEDLGVYTMKDHPVLRHHGEWWETLLYRDTPLFGPLEALEQPVQAWVNVSQMMQAEAVRYIVLSNRHRRGQSCGSIIWQMNEPFPNVSCTNLVEHGGRVKAAYYAVRRAFAPRAVGLRYDSLIQPASAPCRMTVFADAPAGDREATISAEVFALDGRILFAQEATLPLADGRAEWPLAFQLPALETPVFLLRLSAHTGGEALREEYLFPQLEEHPFRPLMTLPAPRLEARRSEGVIMLSNTGSVPALFLTGQCDDPDALLSDGGVTLLPGESVRLEAVPGVWRFTDLAGREVAVC